VHKSPLSKSRAIAIQQVRPDSRQTWIAALVMGMALALVSVVTADAQNRPATFADLAEQVSPSVVNITTSTVIASRTGPQGVVPEGSPFEDFFNDDPGGERRSSALGSGFVISADGFIVTNNHVIEGADEIEIEFFPGDGQPSRYNSSASVTVTPWAHGLAIG